MDATTTTDNGSGDGITLADILAPDSFTPCRKARIAAWLWATDEEDADAAIVVGVVALGQRAGAEEREAFERVDQRLRALGLLEFCVDLVG